MITAADANGQNILHWAAAIGRKDALDAVMAALANRLSQEEVRHATVSLGTPRRLKDRLRGHNMISDQPRYYLYFVITSLWCMLVFGY